MRTSVTVALLAAVLLGWLTTHGLTKSYRCKTDNSSVCVEVNGLVLLVPRPLTARVDDETGFGWGVGEKGGTPEDLCDRSIFCKYGIFRIIDANTGLTISFPDDWHGLLRGYRIRISNGSLEVYCHVLKQIRQSQNAERESQREVIGFSHFRSMEPDWDTYSSQTITFFGTPVVIFCSNETSTNHGISDGRGCRMILTIPSSESSHWARVQIGFNEMKFSSRGWPALIAEVQWLLDAISLGEIRRIKQDYCKNI